MQIRVYYEDTDAGGIVYHSNYLNYCERARSEYFFAKDMLPIIDDAHFVVRKMECDFLASAKFSDILTISTKILKLRNSSFELYQEITIGSKVIFKTTVLLVLVKDGKVQRITNSIKNLILSMFS